MSVASTVILVPVGRAIEPECERGLTDLARRGYAVRAFPSTAALDVARSTAASAALHDGFEDLFWIDSDIGFEADDVERLLAADTSLVCGIYPKRGVPELACHVLPGTKELVFGEGGGLTPILYAGMGFLRSRRDAFEAVRVASKLPECRMGEGEPFHPYFMPMVRDGEGGGPSWYLAEDYAFCERALRAGHRLLADTRVRLHHVGRYGYTWEDAMGPRTRYATVHMRFTPG